MEIPFDCVLLTRSRQFVTVGVAPSEWRVVPPTVGVYPFWLGLRKYHSVRKYKKNLDVNIEINCFLYLRTDWYTFCCFEDNNSAWVDFSGTKVASLDPEL